MSIESARDTAYASGTIELLFRIFGPIYNAVFHVEHLMFVGYPLA